MDYPVLVMCCLLASANDVPRTLVLKSMALPAMTRSGQRQYGAVCRGYDRPSPRRSAGILPSLLELPAVVNHKEDSPCPGPSVQARPPAPPDADEAVADQSAETPRAEKAA